MYSEYISNKLYCFYASRRLYLLLQLLLLLRIQQHSRTFHRDNGFTLVIRCCMRLWMVVCLSNVETALLTLMGCLLLLLLDELELLLLGRVDVNSGESVY